MKNYFLRLIEKIKREFYKPSKKYTYLISFLFQFPRIIIYSLSRVNAKKNILIWDIRNNPITFDFVWLIFDSFFKFNAPRYGFELILFIPNNYKYMVPTMSSYNTFITEKDLKKRINELIIPLANTFRCINKVSIETDINILKKKIKTSRLMPRYYHPRFFIPGPLCYLRVHNILRNEKIIVSNFMDINKVVNTKIKEKYSYLGNNFITISLRDYGYSPGRNTSQHDIDTANFLAKELNCKIIIIPDDLGKIKNYNFYDIDVCESARLNIYERLYLYSKSKVNLAQNSGPSGGSTMLKDSKTIITNYCKGSEDDNYQYFKKEYNIKMGDQPYLIFGTYLLWADLHKDYTTKDLKMAIKEIENNDKNKF